VHLAGRASLFSEAAALCVVPASTNSKRRHKDNGHIPLIATALPDPDEYSPPSPSRVADVGCGRFVVNISEV